METDKSSGFVCAPAVGRWPAFGSRLVQYPPTVAARRKRVGASTGGAGWCAAACRHAVMGWTLRGCVRAL